MRAMQNATAVTATAGMMTSSRRRADTAALRPRNRSVLRRRRDGARLAAATSGRADTLGTPGRTGIVYGGGNSGPGGYRGRGGYRDSGPGRYCGPGRHPGPGGYPGRGRYRGPGGFPEERLRIATAGGIADPGPGVVRQPFRVSVRAFARCLGQVCRDKHGDRDHHQRQEDLSQHGTHISPPIGVMRVTSCLT